MGIIHSITKQTKNKFLNIYELAITHKSGRKGSYFVASRALEKEQLKMITRENTADGVILFTLVRNENEEDKVVLIRQYRYSIDDYIYEFPAGLVDAGENFHQAAVRELHEETGLILEPIKVDREYEKPYFTTIGMTDESCAMVYGYASGSISDQYQEDSEEIQVVLADKEEVRRILREENVSIMCSYMLMHFLHDEEPFAFLKS